MARCSTWHVTAPFTPPFLEGAGRSLVPHNGSTLHVHGFIIETTRKSRGFKESKCLEAGGDTVHWRPSWRPFTNGLWATLFCGRTLSSEFAAFLRAGYGTFGKGRATRCKNSTYTCLGMALYVIHSGGMLIANFYVGLFMHVFLVFPNIIHCHIWKKVETLATSVIKCELSLGRPQGRTAAQQKPKTGLKSGGATNFMKSAS